MDRACVQRARHLRERVGFVDRGTTYKEFADFVEGAAAAADFETFKARWERRRTGIVLTAHPTFGLSDALSKRIVEIAVADDVDPNTRIGVPHRPDENIDLAYEHGRAQNAIQNLRNAYVELLDSFFSAADHRFGDKAYKLRPKLATFACWVGYDLDGRTDIDWRKSFILRLQEKRASLADIRERFLGLKNDLPADGEAQRLSRQVTGKLDLTIAAVDEQIEALDKVMTTNTPLAEAANIITRVGRLQHHHRRADRQPVAGADRSAAGRQGQTRRRRARRPDGGDGPRHRAYPRAHQRRAAQQRLPRLRA